ncbi:MAG: Dabb family protein [Chloroflexota bacterium]
MIRHAVMFNLLPSATTEQFKAVARAAKYSLARIPGVKNLAISSSFEAVQPPAYQYGLTMEFDDEQVMRTYLDHPLHQEFRQIFFPIRGDYLVMTLKEMEVPE